MHPRGRHGPGWRQRCPGPGWGYHHPPSHGGEATWTREDPRADLYESGDRLVLEVELPGIDKEEIELTVEPDRVRIKHEAPEREEPEPREYYRAERTPEGTERTYPLPYTVDPDSVEAEFERGVLRVTMPRSGKNRGRAVDIS